MDTTALITKARVWRWLARVCLCALVASAGAATGAASAGQAYSVTDMRGQVQHFERVPARIVSLLPSLTESVCALGACERLVGVDDFSNYPAQIAHLPRLGKTFAPQWEAIAQLRPDVVLMSYSAPAMERLRQLGIAALALDALDIAQMEQVWQRLDQLLQTDRAQALLSDMQQAVDQEARLLQDHAGQQVYFELDPSPYAAGPASFIGQLLSALGAHNIVPAALGPFPRLSPEWVVRHPPQLIIHTPATASPQFAHRPGWSAIAAVRSGRICTLTAAQADVVSRPGPRLPQAAQALAQCLRMPASAKP